MNSKNFLNEKKYFPYSYYSESYKTLLKKQVAACPWRLEFHIQPSSGLLNDPNGFSYFNSQWHLFYQSYPFGSIHGLKSWNHLVSDNLVEWMDFGTTLLPDSAFDSHGVYSGSALSTKKGLFLAYTGNVRDALNNRTSFQLGALMDSTNNVSKILPPLIKSPPKGFTQNFRDPQLIEYDGHYYIIIGAQDKNSIGKILMYKSEDLLHWEYCQEIPISRDMTGYMVECPNIIFINNQPLLIFCPQGLNKEKLDYQNIYPNTYLISKSIASFKNISFENTTLKNLDEGFDIYATQAFNAPDGRALSVSWIGLPEVSIPTEANGWSHCLSLVKELTLKENHLFQYPVQETNQLRTSKSEFVSHYNEIYELISKTTIGSELEISFSSGSKGMLLLYSSPDKKNYLRLEFDTISGKMTVDRTNSGVSFSTDFGTIRECSFIKNQPLILNIFMDASTCEIFVNKGYKVFTLRLFPNQNQTNIFANITDGVFKGTKWLLKKINHT